MNTDAELIMFQYVGSLQGVQPLDKVKDRLNL